MSKLDSMPGCSGPDFGSELPDRPAALRRPRPRWGGAFHKDHDHPHDHMGRPGPARYAGPSRRVFTIGVAGPVGSGKTALVETLCRALWPEINLAVITNDIYTHEDAEFLSRRQVLPLERIVGVQTGGFPPPATRDGAKPHPTAPAHFSEPLPRLA